MTCDQPLTQRASFKLYSTFFLDRSCQFSTGRSLVFVPSYSEVLVLLKGKPLLYVKTPCFHCRNKLEFLLFIQLSSELKRNLAIYFFII